MLRYTKMNDAFYYRRKERVVYQVDNGGCEAVGWEV
jgi:hypothetical protein